LEKVCGPVGGSGNVQVTGACETGNISGSKPVKPEKNGRGKPQMIQLGCIKWQEKPTARIRDFSTTAEGRGGGSIVLKTSHEANLVILTLRSSATGQKVGDC